MSDGFFPSHEQGFLLLLCLVINFIKKRQNDKSYQLSIAFIIRCFAHVDGSAD